MLTIRKLAIASVSLLALATPAMAQEAAPVDTSEETFDAGNEIVVEARRRDESAQDVPLSVNAVTAASIQNLNLREFQDVSSIVPGLAMNSNANGIGTTSSVRGVNFDVNASGNNGTIEYYLNDAPMSSGPLFQAMYDIGQIEVLRGPQGTLRGRASPSGSITINYKRPDMQEVGGYASGTVNDIGTTNINGAINIPVIEDMLAIRVGGLIQEGEGNRVRSINNDTDPSTKTQSGRVMVRFDPVDFISLEGMYQNVNTDSVQFDQVASFNLYSPTAPASPVTIRPGERKAISRVAREVSQNFDMFTWKGSVALEGQRLIYVGSRSEQTIKSNDPTQGDPAVFFDVPFDGQINNTIANGTSHEVRLQNEDRIFDSFDYVVGYFNQTLKSPTNLLQNTPIGLPNGTLLATNTTPIDRVNNTKEESFFANLTYHLGDGTEFSGGARHIKYHAVGSLTVGGVDIPDADQNDRWNETIFAASVKHRFNDNILAYANFGTSFRPGVSAVGDFSLNRSDLENSFLVLPPETSESYEIGLKTDLLDDTLRFNVAVYQQDFKNYPYRSSSGVYFVSYNRDVNSPTGMTPTVDNFNFVSAVPVRVRGVEAELTYRPNSNFNLSANIAYADGNIRNGLIACNDINKDGIPDVVTQAPTLEELQNAHGSDNIGSCRVNQRSANAPRWSGNFQAEYSTPVTDSFDGYLRGLLTWNGNSEVDPANFFDGYGAYGLLNLFAGVRAVDGSWEVSAFAKNLTDNGTVLTVGNGPLSTVYRNAAAGFAETVHNSTYTNITTVAPREFGITAKIAFGSR